MPCHNARENPGIVFNRLSDLQDRKATVEYVVRQGLMPKTHSDSHYRAFANEIYMTDEDRRALLDFLRSSKRVIQKIPYVQAEDVSQKNVLSFKAVVHSKGTGDDNYAIVKIPFSLSREPVWVNGYRVKTSSPRDFHHIGIFVIKQDTRNPNLHQGLASFYHGSVPTRTQEDTLERLYHLMNIIPPQEQFFWDWMAFKTEWQIGGGAFHFPEGSGFMMPKSGVILLNNVHLRPTPKDKDLSIEIEFYYSSTPPDKRKYLYVVDIANVPDARLEPPLKIPAGARQQHVLSATLPDDMLLHAVSPHMHFLGRKFEAYAKTPKGDTIKIIRINDWDPDWMKTYQYEKPLFLPKGSVFYSIGYYDNSSDNPRNPNRPPRDVGNAMLFREEMLNMIITFTEP